MNPSLEEVPCTQYSFHGSNGPNNSLNASQIFSTKLHQASNLSNVKDGLETGTKYIEGLSTFKEVKR